ncbi:MAG: hypothetical protein ACFFDI_23690 [Promethearchaeota archaeon]
MTDDRAPRGRATLTYQKYMTKGRIGAQIQPYISLFRGKCDDIGPVSPCFRGCIQLAGLDR